MPLRPEDWARARELFENALALPEGDRGAYVAGACGGDHALRDEIERMLDSHGRAAGFLSTPAAALLDVSVARSLEGQRIGPYQLSSRIGAGGMGEVTRRATPASLGPSPSRFSRPRSPTTRTRGNASRAKDVRSPRSTIRTSARCKTLATWTARRPARCCSS
jgi:hypothetical protein